MSNVETYREKATECERAANVAHDSTERVELFGLASVYMALADYVDHQREPQMAHGGNQDEDMQRHS